MWVGAVRNSLYSINSRQIAGDIRFFKSPNDNYKYLASWIYFLKANDASSFLITLQNCIRESLKSSKNYLTPDLNKYAINLSLYRRERLIKWLFKRGPLTGWIFSQPFDSMDPFTRYRKGMSIQLEHDFSIQLQNAGFVLISLKKNSKLGLFANFGDRLLNLYFRIRFYFRNF
jgi:hypothetical protein